MMKKPAAWSPSLMITSPDLDGARHHQLANPLEVLAAKLREYRHVLQHVFSAHVYPSSGPMSWPVVAPLISDYREGRQYDAHGSFVSSGG